MKTTLFRHLPFVLIAGTLSGCIGTNSESLFGTREGAGKRDPLAALAEFPGCIEGYALSPSRIHLEFAFPPDASMMRIYRDGIQIMSTHISTTTTYVDENLNEGREYTYTCEASIRGISKLGTNILKIETDSVNPPTFEGIKSAVALGPTSVRVTWNPPGFGSVAAKTYKIYANMGGTLNWNAAPRTTLNEGAKQYTLTGLGDEMPYTFGVEACSGAGVCARGLSGASVTLGVTTPDGGAPQTVGPVSATATNSYVHLSAPWSESNGALKRRRVYQKLGALSTNIGDYTLVYTSALISDPTTPPTTLSVSGVLENTQYHYILVDEDPIGNTKQSAILSYLTGDLTPPTFSGASSAVLVAPKDSSVQLSFTAVNRQWPGAEDTADGTAYYVVYTASLPYATYVGNPGSLPDACGPSGTLWGQPISSQTYAPGAQTYTMTGLTERTTYSICLKARDFAGNVSTGSTALTITTIDITPPLFDGIQALSFDTPTAKLILGWNPHGRRQVHPLRRPRL